MNFNFKNLKEFFRDKSRDNLYQNLKDIGVDCNLAERGLNEESTLVPVTNFLLNKNFELVEWTSHKRIAALYKNRYFIN